MKMFPNMSLLCQAVAPAKGAANFGSKKPLILLPQRDQTVIFLRSIMVILAQRLGNVENTEDRHVLEVFA